MTTFKIVLVPFPFDDLSSSKVRPAICLTEPIGPHRHIVLAFLTSQVLSQPLPSDLIIHPNTEDFQKTGLRIASTLQLHRLSTLASSTITRELGNLPLKLQLQVEQKLRVLFGLK